MRMVQIFEDNSSNNLMKRVDAFFVELEEKGYEVICTSYSIAGISRVAAFIDYQPKQITKTIKK